MSDETSDYINNLWDLDSTRNSGVSVEDQKKQFAFQVWREDFKNFQKREDSKKSDIKDTWTEVYQLIGFYSVFQGVWFQGVAQLAASQRGCKFSIIPIILSVLVSLATIVGIYVKLTQILVLQEAFFKDKLASKIRQSKISAFENEGLKVIEKSTHLAEANVKLYFEEKLGSTNRYRLVVLVLLAIFSALFEWMIYMIMCE